MQIGDKVVYKQAPISYYLTIGDEYEVKSKTLNTVTIINDKGELRNYPRKCFGEPEAVLGTLKSLKTGMAVLLYNGCRAIVMKDTVCGSKLMIEGGGFEGLDNYKDNLYHRHNAGYDIVAIRSDISPLTIGTFKQDKVWGRPKPIKEVTMAEIEKHYGCRVKIIKE